jgi:hypothetical protein
MPEGGIRARIVARLARARFVREAVAEKGDLSALWAALREKKTPRVWVGLGIVGFSYLLGWPAVGLLAVIAYRLREPLVILVGGPVIYALSYVVLLAGSWLAGARYAGIVLRWVTRWVVEKLGGPVPPPVPPATP